MVLFAIRELPFNSKGCLGVSGNFGGGWNFYGPRMVEEIVSDPEEQSG